MPKEIVSTHKVHPYAPIISGQLPRNAKGETSTSGTA